MLIPEFMGGLGNMMFQYASTYSISKYSGHDFKIIDIPMPPEKHSNIDYKYNILKKWIEYKIDINDLDENRVFTIYNENDSKIINLNIFKSINNDTVVKMHGYYQYENYLRPYKNEIINLFDLSIEDSILNKYKDINNAYFLHIRRGDYVGNSYHELDLTNYYTKAINHIINKDIYKDINNPIAYIVSNDIEWCKNWSIIKDIPHRFIEENDVNTLLIMMRCGLGGITANSTYSWWGLYLNTDRPNLIIPDRWFPHNHIPSDRLYFKEATIISIN